jgi:putative transposase
MHLPALMASPGFEILGAGSPRRLPEGLLDGIPQAAAERAMWWHRHMT